MSTGRFVVRTTISRLKASTAKYRNPSLSLLLPFVLASNGHALPFGAVGMIYNGALPSDVMTACVQDKTCTTKGVQEVWFGAGNSWIYKLVNGTINCNVATFSDPAPGTFKACYARDLTTSELQPPRVNEIPLTFELNNLLTVQDKRYTFDVWDGETNKPITTNTFEINLKPAPTKERMQQNFYQFDIIDGASPIRQHSVFISPTFNRCMVSRLDPTGNIVSTYGRIVEIYSMTAIPSSQYLAQRSDTQKVCTNDRSQLKFQLKPPSIDSFQVKIIAYDAYGKQNDVFDLFIPIHFDWKTN
jgi:hypothetical protein